MSRRWIYNEQIGNGVFSIADLDGVLKFVWLDKYGIANIFSEIVDFIAYLEGGFSCNRECIEPYETDREGYDFIDDYLKIDEV
jgi:hypothetical protein